MIVGYHIIFGAYGFWLPNDPRGSWSNFVGSWELARFGPATKTTETQSLAYRAHEHAERYAAKLALKRRAVRFTGLQARAVARGFGQYADRAKLPIFACAILPDHVHLVTALSDIAANQISIQLKAAATSRLLLENIHPFGHLRDQRGRPPKCFARGQWKVFLDPNDVDRAIHYVEQNPIKEGKKRQFWNFVTPHR